MKAALTRAANGRGDLGQLLHEIERVAKYVTGDTKATLGKAKESMRTVVGRTSAWAVMDTGLRKMSWETLYGKVRCARNDLAHTGTEAVLARTLVMALATVLMEALLGVASGGDKVKRVRDVMVAGPVCAHEWQTVADVRRTMLVTDFSELPMANGSADGEWEMVTAAHLAAYLAREREKRMEMSLAQARSSDPCPLRLHKVAAIAEDTPVCDIWNGAGDEPDLPRVVTRKSSLIGIVTSFDLL